MYLTSQLLHNREAFYRTPSVSNQYNCMVSNIIGLTWLRLENSTTHSNWTVFVHLHSQSNH